MELPVRIRELRIAKDLTLDQLSDLVGVSTPHLSEVERGKKNLNNHLLVRIADALDVKPSDIISADDITPLAALYYEMSELDEADQARVREFIGALRRSKLDDEDLLRLNRADAVKTYLDRIDDGGYT